MFCLVWEIKGGTFYFSSICVDTERTSEKYEYFLKMSVFRETISIRSACDSYLQGKDEVLQPGECLTLSYGTVVKYPNNLICEVQMIRSEGVTEEHFH
jgi:hypothetical protein